VAGVRYLHNHSPVIIHGDLKPVGLKVHQANTLIHFHFAKGNVLIDDEGVPKICDFGLVRIFLEEGHSGLTTTSDHTVTIMSICKIKTLIYKPCIQGTDRYLAPELVACSDASLLSPASDIYAIGCIGLEVCSCFLSS
jgi:serine/threonine protein kinase